MESISINLQPGEKVKIIIDGTYLTGEIVRRSKTNPRKWLVRTYYDKEPKYFDDLLIISDRREKFYKKAFKKGTLVKVKDLLRIGIVVEEFVRYFGDSFVYMPIVLVGSEVRPFYPESLQNIKPEMAYHQTHSEASS